MEDSGQRLASHDMVAQDTAPGPAGPLEEPAPMAAPAPELSQPPGPPAAEAAGPVLDDVLAVDAAEEQLPAAGGAGGRR